MPFDTAKVEAFVLRDVLSRAFYFSQWEYAERRICLVKLTCSDGTVGWGEGYGRSGVPRARGVAQQRGASRARSSASPSGALRPSATAAP